MMNAFGWEYGRMYECGPSAHRDSYSETVSAPLVLRSSISCDAFLWWLETSDDVPPRWQFEASHYNMGRVVVYSPPTLVHERTATAIVASIRDQVMQVGEDSSLEDALVPPASLVCRVDDRIQAPDDALVPADATKDSFPTLVVEVAYTNETLAMLQKRLAHWVHGRATTSTGVQVAIGVKIYTNTNTPKFTIMVMQPGAATQFVEVGGRGRVSAWQPATKSATFPLGALFRGFTLPSALLGQERKCILIDADDVRSVVQRAQRTMRRRGARP